MTGPRTREHVRWSDEKIRQFVKRWDAGVDAATLQETYGRKPWQIARDLRARGVVLKDRRRGNAARQPCVVEPKWVARVDVEASGLMWEGFLQIAQVRLRKFCEEVYAEGVAAERKRTAMKAGGAAQALRSMAFDCGCYIRIEDLAVAILAGDTS